MLADFWRSLKPVHQAHHGTLWAVSGASVIALIVGSLNLKSGFGLWVDFSFLFAAAAVALPLVAVMVVVTLTVLRNIPRLLVGVFVAVVLLLALPWLNAWGYLVGAALLLIQCALGASVATILLGGLRYAALGKKVVTFGLGGLALSANLGLLAFLRSDGIDDQWMRAPAGTSLPPPLSAPNPAARGNYAVKTLLYGYGRDLRRSEYGPSVAIRTNTVDASSFFADFTGWKARLRKQYWGFGMDRLPLNGRVWYPGGAGPFPLVLMVHGNHEMSDFSDAGYAYLGELLASRGFIFVSIDENFLNVGLFHEPPAAQPVRAWLMLEHLKVWRQWNANSGNPFYGKIDTANVALMGHSRGGEAAATAFLFNKLAYDPDDASIRFQYGYPIKSVVAIAPAGGGQALDDVNYLTIQGAHDADVSSFLGSRQWDRVRFSGQGEYFKSELYVYGANHGQFNTAWGRSDTRGPKGWFLNLRPLLSGADQRKIAQLYVAAFLEATLHERREYRGLFRDYRQARQWLPKTLYIDRYLDSSNKLIADFSEDSDLTTTTLPGGRIEGRNLTEWREGKIPFRNGDRGYNGVFLGWNAGPTASYAFTLPAGLMHEDSILTMSIAVTDEDSPADFTVALESDDSAQVRLPVSRFRVLRPSIPVRFTKLEYLDRLLYKEPSEPVFQSVEMPLRDFMGADPRFNPKRLTRMRLIFDRTPASSLLISQISLEQAPVDSAIGGTATR
jgi:dienelactone hydrolase